MVVVVHYLQQQQQQQQQQVVHHHHHHHHHSQQQPAGNNIIIDHALHHQSYSTAEHHQHAPPGMSGIKSEPDKGVAAALGAMLDCDLNLNGLGGSFEDLLSFDAFEQDGVLGTSSNSILSTSGGGGGGAGPLSASTSSLDTHMRMDHLDQLILNTVGEGG